MVTPQHAPAWAIFAFGVLMLSMGVASTIGAWHDRRAMGGADWFGPFLFIAMAFTLVAGGLGIMAIGYTWSAWWPASSPRVGYQNLAAAVALGVAIFGWAFARVAAGPAPKACRQAA